MATLSVRQFATLILGCGMLALFWVKQPDRVHQLSSGDDRPTFPTLHPECRPKSRRGIENRLAKIRDCLLQDGNWDINELHILVNRCGVGELEFMQFFRDHHHKIFVPIHGTQWGKTRAIPAPMGHVPVPGNDCVVVTLGIGDDTVTERDLAAHYPMRCRFYGADPTPPVSQGFRRYGTYFPVAVDDISRPSQTVSVMATNDTNGVYKDASFPTVGLGKFLYNLAALADVRMIHFMSLDVEGAEYRILPLLSRWGRHDQNKSTTHDLPVKPPVRICQIMVELHFPTEKYMKDPGQFKTIFLDFVANSDFVPIRALVPRTHQYFLAVNRVDMDCIKQLVFDQRDPRADDWAVDLGPTAKPPTGATLFPQMNVEK